MFSAMCATSVGLFFGQYDRARIERHCCRDIDKSGVDVGKRFNVAGHFFFYRAELVACSARPVATVAPLCYATVTTSPRPLRDRYR